MHSLHAWTACPLHCRRCCGSGWALRTSGRPPPASSWPTTWKSGSPTTGADHHLSGTLACISASMTACDLRMSANHALPDYYKCLSRPSLLRDTLQRNMWGLDVLHVFVLTMKAGWLGRIDLDSSICQVQQSAVAAVPDHWSGLAGWPGNLCCHWRVTV
jgi:hypothetical protein